MGSVKQEPVFVSLKVLQAGTVPLSTLEEAFGPYSLGILIVKELPPNFQTLRTRILSYASYLAQLPKAELDSLTDPTCFYNVGWSHGVEKLKDGRYDTHKGSYYANVLFSHLKSELAATQEGQKLPSHVRFSKPNIWPSDDTLPGFKQTFEELCTLIIDIAVLVSQACDKFAIKYVDNYEPGLLERVVKTSLTMRARLLHYFPPEQEDSTPEGEEKEFEVMEEEDDDSWCAAHVDDSCLTGLMSALYVDESEPLPPLDKKTGALPALKASSSNPDPLAGLYIRSRTSEVVKVNIPADCLAFQTGQALEMFTGGKLKAVPHLVRGPRKGMGKNVARNTMAVFTQPNEDEVIDRRTGMTFADFMTIIDEKHS